MKIYIKRYGQDQKVILLRALIHQQQQQKVMEGQDVELVLEQS